MEYDKFKIHCVILFIICSSISSFLNISVAQNNSKADAIVGKWLTEDKDAIVQIFKSKGKYYGRLFWIKDPLDEDGKPKLDKENPDPELRSRPLKGLIFLHGFVYDEDDNEWEDGKIYDPKTGNTYSSYMELDGNNTLNLRGYIGFSVFGRTSVWTRKD